MQTVRGAADAAAFPASGPLPSVSFYTLGCKLNQLETEALADAFWEAGFPILPWDGAERAALLVLNTCTVTSKAEQKARRIIRLFLNAGSAVLVTGCYAQLDRERIAALGRPGEALCIVPGAAKDTLLDLPRSLLNAGTGAIVPDFFSDLPEYFIQRSRRPGDPECVPNPRAVPDNSIPAVFRFNPRHFSFHSRAYLKLQDGCDRACAYCRVPLARGKSVSLEAAELVRRLRALEDAGMAEAVLTGVNIFHYRDGEIRLPGLLKLLLDNTGTIALRLSSIEPEPRFAGRESLFPQESWDDFFRIVSRPRIRRHFHLSVQSGSKSVLAAMGRPYTPEDIIRTAQKLREAAGDPFLACDIITGFPGESEADFEQTLSLCRAVDFAWIHAFPYSKRPGTQAASMKGQVDQRTAGRRLGILAELAREGRAAYTRRWLGKTVDAVAETDTESAPENTDTKSGPFFPALADNYIRVRVEAEGRAGPRAGSALRCTITAQECSGAFDARAKMVYSDP